MQEWPRSAPMPAHENSQPLTSQGSVMNSLCSPRGWIYQCFVWATFCTYCTENCAYWKQSPTDILSLPHGWIYKKPFVLITWMNLSTTFCTGYVDQHKWQFCTHHMDKSTNSFLYSSHGWIYQQPFVLATWTSINDNSVLTTWTNLQTAFCTHYGDESINNILYWLRGPA